MRDLEKLAQLKRKLYYCQEELYNLEYNDITNTYCDHLNLRLDDLFEEIHKLSQKVNKNINFPNKL